MVFKVTDISSRPKLIPEAAEWFSDQWGIPREVYENSMKESCGENAVPRWYIVMIKDAVIAGLGVIENDFHERKDLTPNVCAVYVSEGHRGMGIAGELLDHACEDMKRRGIDTLYLTTDYVGFYERYGWEFLTMVKSRDGESRMYIKKT